MQHCTGWALAYTYTLQWSCATCACLPEPHVFKLHRHLHRCKTELRLPPGSPGSRALIDLMTMSSAGPAAMHCLPSFWCCFCSSLDESQANRVTSTNSVLDTTRRGRLGCGCADTPLPGPTHTCLRVHIHMYACVARLGGQSWSPIPDQDLTTLCGGRLALCAGKALQPQLERCVDMQSVVHIQDATRRRFYTTGNSSATPVGQADHPREGQGLEAPVLLASSFSLTSWFKLAYL